MDDSDNRDPQPSQALSKTRRKAQMHALQHLGERLVGLDPARLAELDLPETLVEAVAEARSIRKHEARRRQMQYIGRLMREVDPAPIEARFAAWAGASGVERALHRAAERWRDRLLAGGAGVDEWLAEHPSADRVRIRALIARARTEHESGQPPRAYRELYRLVRETLARRGSATHAEHAVDDSRDEGRDRAPTTDRGTPRRNDDE